MPCTSNVINVSIFSSGLSPFLDDSIEETTTNILKCDFCFPDEYFGNVSSHAKNLIGELLCLRGEERATARFSLSSPWFQVTVYRGRQPAYSFPTQHDSTIRFSHFRFRYQSVQRYLRLEWLHLSTVARIARNRTRIETVAFISQVPSLPKYNCQNFRRLCK